MEEFTLEVCADSVESAIAAEQGGADRIELCANLVIGGTTPGPALFQEVRKHIGLPVRVLIRPRFGDFCYTEYELAVMRQEIELYKELGAEGVVLGVLKPDGRLDMANMEKLMEAAGNMKVTLHRAFDVCIDPRWVLEQAIELKIDTILTSGQENCCIQGVSFLKELSARAGDRITIMAGGGVSAAVIPQLWKNCGITTYHMSGKKLLNSRMSYRNEDVAMGLPSLSEYTIYRTDEEQVREARKTLEELYVFGKKQEENPGGI